MLIATVYISIRFGSCLGPRGGGIAFLFGISLWRADACCSSLALVFMVPVLFTRKRVNEVHPCVPTL